MILVTVGTNEQPFDRLVRAAAALEGPESLLVQHGSSQVPPGQGTWVDFLPFDELEAHARRARALVCHAGVGSIMLARRCGHRAIVMPRRHELGEAVDDHQIPLARRLERAGLVTVVEDVASLEAALVLAQPAAPAPHVGEGREVLISELRGTLAELGARPSSARTR